MSAPVKYDTALPPFIKLATNSEQTFPGLAENLNLCKRLGVEVAYQYLICRKAASDASYWMIRTLFIAFLWMSLNHCPVNLLLAQSHQTEAIIVKHFIQRCNNLTTNKACVEPRSCSQGCRKNDILTLFVVQLI